jgi:hypothetical protein
MAPSSRSAWSALILGLLFFTHGPALASTVSGDIDVDTTWDTAGSPYSVTGNVTVRSGATLTIEPGVMIRLNEFCSIFVDPGCTLVAEGTPEGVITFTHAQTGNWGVIASQEGTMTFRHCLLEWGYFVGPYAGMISHIFGTTTVEDCVLQNAPNGCEFQAGAVTFRRNLVQFINAQGFISFNHCITILEDNRIQHTFSDDAFDISEVNGAEIVFRNNIVEDIGDDAIDMDNWQFATIENFEGYDIHDKGVDVSSSSTSVVAQNMIIVNAHSGYEASRNSHLTAYNCVAYNCARGFVAERIDPPYNGGTIDVANSIAWGCTQPLFVDGLSTANIWYSIIDTTNAGPGTVNMANGVLNADPRFLDPANRDFRLAYNSPAIDAGTSDATPDHDIRGRAREDDPYVPDTGCCPPFFPTYWDIGAHEFDPSLIAVGDGGAPAVSRLGLRAYPSPASGPIGIAFDVTRPGPVEVGVYDVAGRLVKSLQAGLLPAGAHRLTWDGSGAAPESGIYFIRLKEGTEQAVEKVVRVR